MIFMVLLMLLSCMAVGFIGFWRIIQLHAPHTCQMDLTYNAPRQMPSKMIGAYFALRLLKEDYVLRPKDMINEM